MPTTSRGYRYPASSAAPNVPQDVQNLASDLNTDVGAINTRVNNLEGSGSWTTLPLDAAVQNWTGTAGPVPGYKKVGSRVWVQGYVQRVGGTLFTFGTAFTIATLPTGNRPLNRSALYWGMSQFSSTNPPIVRVEVATTGVLTAQPIAPSGTSPAWLMFDFSFDINR